jgi:hypothetical protein
MNEINEMIITDSGLETLDNFRANNRFRTIGNTQPVRIECEPRNNPLMGGGYDYGDWDTWYGGAYKEGLKGEYLVGYTFQLVIFKLANGYRTKKAILDCKYFRHPTGGKVMNCFVAGDTVLAKKVKFWQYIYSAMPLQYQQEGCFVGMSPLVFAVHDDTGSGNGDGKDFEVSLLDQTVFMPWFPGNPCSSGRVDARDFNIKLFNSVVEPTDPNDKKEITVVYGENIV